MIKLVKATVSAAVALLVTAGVASADMPRDVVKDTRGQIVVNTFGNCVRTKWQAEHDECGGINREALTVYFDFNSSALTPAAKAKLDSLVDIILNSSEVASVTIVGYADMIGSTDYNYRLSQRRAESVRNYLASKGYYDTRNTDVRSFGESSPVSSCQGVTGNELKACLWRDRRVEIELNYQ